MHSLCHLGFEHSCVRLDRQSALPQGADIVVILCHYAVLFLLFPYLFFKGGNMPLSYQMLFVY